MNYATIKPKDIANGTGVRVSLFVAGCRHHCPDCFNESAWDFSAGQPFTKSTVDHILELLKPDYIEGLTLLGGEPFEPENQEELLKLTNIVKKTYPNKNIWCYTGFSFEKELLGQSRAKTPYTIPLLKNIDVLVDGRFVKELYSLSLKFRGSSNQKIILVQESLKNNRTVLSPLNKEKQYNSSTQLVI